MNAIIIAYLFVSLVVVPIVMWCARKRDDQAPRWARIKHEMDLRDQLLEDCRRVA